MAVYMIRAGDTGPVKLGFAVNPDRRIGGLQIGHPEKLTVLRIMEGCRAFEAALHRHFAPLRIRGEWFTHSDEMLGDLEHLRPAANNNDVSPSAPRAVKYDDALVRVLEKAGGPSKLAEYLGVVPSAVTQWIRVPARHLFRLEALTGIPGRDIRPDLWDAPAAATPEPIVANDAPTPKPAKRRNAA